MCEIDICPNDGPKIKRVIMHFRAVLCMSTSCVCTLSYGYRTQNVS